MTKEERGGRDGQNAQKLEKLEPQPSSFELEACPCPESGSEFYYVKLFNCQFLLTKVLIIKQGNP